MAWENDCIAVSEHLYTFCVLQSPLYVDLLLLVRGVFNLCLSLTGCLCVADGCQIVLFTTGRGTPFGTFVPTAKISTNSTLAANKPLWIDFNAGEIVDGKPVADVDSAFVDFVLSVASGTPVNNEKSGYTEIAIFKSGVTL